MSDIKLDIQYASHHCRGTHTLTLSKMQTALSNNKYHLLEDVYKCILLVSNLRLLHKKNIHLCGIGMELQIVGEKRTVSAGLYLAG